MFLYYMKLIFTGLAIGMLMVIIDTYLIPGGLY